jgi:hypothetical protein
MFPGQSEIDRIVRKLHESPWKAVIACTGAGAGLQQLLWSVPGASATVLDAVMPYDKHALADFIGHEPEKYCSRDTALWMASAAYRRAFELGVRGGEQKPHVMGLGLTAVVATSEFKKGGHRLFVAVKTADELATVSVTLTRGRLDRPGEGAACDLVALNAMLAIAGLPQALLGDCGLASEEVMSGPEGCTVAPRGIERFEHAGIDPFEKPLFLADGSRSGLDALDPAKHILFPGSFAPLHFGHESMAMQTERMTGKKVVFAITGTHPDKGVIPAAELLRRAEQFRWSWPVAFTEGAALYVEKARMFPKFGFLIGVDAVLGILDPKYYGGVGGRDAMLAELASLGTRFHVVGRQIGDKFVTLDDVDVPERFARVFQPVSGRWDVRSRDLR